MTRRPSRTPSAFAQSRETPRRLSTLAPSPTALGPGESIGATEFYEGARMVKPGFEPLEVTAWECSIARRDRRERLDCRAAKPRDERAPRNDFLWVQIPAGAERRPTLANASGFARSRETPGVSRPFRERWRGVSEANASCSRTVSGANRETKRAEPRETSDASLPVLAPSPTALGPGVHASGASVGSGDERSESPGESTARHRARIRFGWFRDALGLLDRRQFRSTRPNDLPRCRSRPRTWKLSTRRQAR